MTDEEFAAFERAIVAKSLEELSAGRYAGHQITDLEAAFRLVRPAGNWKLPIDATVPAGTDLSLIDAAVCFYTGGPIETQPLPDGRHRVTAPGYYACIGA